MIHPKNWECSKLSQMTHLKINTYIDRMSTLNCIWKYTQLGKKASFWKKYLFLKNNLHLKYLRFLAYQKNWYFHCYKVILSLESMTLFRELIKQVMIIWEKTLHAHLGEWPRNNFSLPIENFVAQRKIFLYLSQGLLISN